MKHPDNRSDAISPGFEKKLLSVPIASILPVKQLPVTVPKSQKYAQIAASIREVGLIEPPVISRAKGQRDTFILLDGHVRLLVLKELGEETVTCLVATDDEAFTYNKRISRLATIQEHKMILRAVERGVPEARIAAALNVDVALIRRKRNLLNGISAEAAELLKARHCPINSFRALRKMKPLRQIQAAELMIAANNYTVAYAEAILAATDAADLVDPAARKSPVGVTREQSKKLVLSKSRNTETTRKLMDMLAESAAREERQRAEIKAALAEATNDWLATLDDQARTTFFAAIEGVISLTIARRLAKHPDRPEAVDVLVVGAREKEAQQKEAERKQRLKDAEARDLARLAALKEKYEGAAVGKATPSTKQAND